MSAQSADLSNCSVSREEEMILDESEVCYVANVYVSDSFARVTRIRYVSPRYAVPNHASI